MKNLITFSILALSFYNSSNAQNALPETGITLHSFYTPKLTMVYDNLVKLGIKPREIQKNEFGENSFVFKGTDGVSWQIIEKLTAPKYNVVKKLVFKMTNN